MKTNYRRLNATFAPETRFDLRPNPAAPFSATQDSEFERLKSRLLLERLEKQPEPETNSALRQVANEAAALAWVTPFPLLVFPLLFEEKANAALQRSERQARILALSNELLSV